MPAQYRSFDPHAEIIGDSVRGVLAAFQLAQEGEQLLLRHGLPAQPQPGVWYSMQAWLNVLGDLEDRYGSETVYAAGLQMATHSVWPPNLYTLHEALRALDAAYRANVRGENMGYYRIEGVGLREIRVVCLTPNPLDFDCGIVTGLSRRFKPLEALWVRVEKEATPAGSEAGLKWLRVSW